MSTSVQPHLRFTGYTKGMCKYTKITILTNGKMAGEDIYTIYKHWCSTLKKPKTKKPQTNTHRKQL